eukprot:CAMPEP_0194489632 /NCGR_PEP_ID=MMETSP0253-20130528/9108_1 /TAXON_ID=2966 /ORGANISM="Noctiluca scintillans" /LENGTH=489 /DNA_ID=CAMNT_0039330129 /DNA_START=36 /DNA_END=1502 /DNA_ORIENTATION=-
MARVSRTLTLVGHTISAQRQKLNRLYHLPLARSVRLRPEHDTVGVTPDEAFWNFLFSTAFGPTCVGSILFEGRYPWAALYFLAFYNIWASMGRYASRLNDTDLLHRVAWSVWGMGVLAMVLFAEPVVGNVEYFSYAVAAVKSCSWLLFLRVALRSRAARPMAIIHLIGQGVDVSLWLVVGTLMINASENTQPRYLLMITACDVGEFLTGLPCYTRVAHPASHQYTTMRAQNLQMMILGVALVGSVMPLKGHPLQPECLAIAASAAIFTISARVLLQEVEAVLPAEHARLVSPRRAHVWSKLQMAMAAATMSHSAGLHGLINGCCQALPRSRGGTLATLGSAFMLAVIAALDNIHQAPTSRYRSIAHMTGAVVAFVTYLVDRWTGVSRLFIAVVLALDAACVVVAITFLSPDRQEQEHTSKDSGHPRGEVCSTLSASSSRDSMLSNGDVESSHQCVLEITNDRETTRFAKPHSGQESSVELVQLPTTFDC